MATPTIITTIQRLMSPKNLIIFLSITAIYSNISIEEINKNFFSTSVILSSLKILFTLKANLLALLATALTAWSNWTMIGKLTRSISYKTVYCVFNSLLFALSLRHIENLIRVPFNVSRRNSGRPGRASAKKTKKKQLGY